MGNIAPINELDVLKNHAKYDKAVVKDLMTRIMAEPAKFSDEMIIAANNLLKEKSLETINEASEKIKGLNK